MEQLLTSLFESKYYDYKDSTYRVMGVVKVKHPVSGKWVMGVKYKKAVQGSGDYSGWTDIKDSPEYVRLYDDFIDKFRNS